MLLQLPSILTIDEISLSPEAFQLVASLAVGEGFKDFDFVHHFFSFFLSFSLTSYIDIIPKILEKSILYKCFFCDFFEIDRKSLWRIDLRQKTGGRVFLNLYPI